MWPTLATSQVPAFEMQRQAARDYKVNKKVQETAKARLAATNTFRQRLPPYAGPRVRGYRAQEVRFPDMVSQQDVDEGEEGFLQGGGLVNALRTVSLGGARKGG